MTDPIAFHESEMIRCFESGKFAEARFNCRIWTRLVAGKFSMTAQAGQPGTGNPVHPCAPSPNSGLDGRTGNGW